MPVRKVSKPANPVAKKVAASKSSSAASAVEPAPAVTPTVVETKPKKPKLMRDSFTIPKDEYAVVDVLKRRAAQQGHVIKKSELLRAGLKLLANLNDKQLLAAMQAVPSIKTGRPAKTEELPSGDSAATQRSVKSTKISKPS